jgi:broad specificity phosphatase PhoE
MKLVYFITHPDVVIDPEIPVPRWPLSERGRERMKKLLAKPWIKNLGSIYCSTEQKAIDGAAILAEHLSLRYEMVKGLEEIDRSSTGYLPHAEHAATAAKFFADPERSIRGWETARNAQQRIIEAVEGLIEKDRGSKNIAIVSHGAVGVLYLCRLKQCPISAAEGSAGANGGSYYCFEVISKALVHGWQLIDE